MAVSDPPFSTPRIMKVLDPGTGYYEVIVRMDPTAASKFPDEPFGTGIDQIGLAQKDASKYVGYTLVSIEPADKGAKDHYWIFQKLDGPEFTTISKSKESLTPAKYRSQTVIVKTEQEVDSATQPSTLTGELMSSVVAQIPNTGKALLSETTEVIGSGGPLFGLERNKDGSLSQVSEMLVEDGAATDSGPFVIKSDVTPIGNGKSIKVTVTADTIALSADNPATNRIINRVTPLGTDVLFTEVGVMPSVIPIYGSPHYDAVSWPNHKLILIKPMSDSTARYQFFYAADRENQDLYNWEHSKANIGGQQFDSVKRTYLTLRADFNPSLPLAGESMSNVPSGVFEFFDDYVLSDRTQTRTNEAELDSLYVTEVRVYVRKTTQRQTDYDEQFGKPLFTIQTLYFATEIVTGTTIAAVLFASTTDPFWGLQANGYMREGKQLSTNWYVITERQIIPTALVTTGRSYTTTVDFSWPAVLSSIEIDTWNRKDGGYEEYIRPVYSADAYRGPCRALVTETFHVSAPAATTPTVMKPLPINISTPLFSVSIGPTLHEAYNLVITTGSNHPTYESTVASYAEPETEPKIRPADAVASDTIEPFRGGFLRRLVTVYAP